MFNTKTIILNDYKTADDLLNRRSAIYSTRPTLWMSVHLVRRQDAVCSWFPGVGFKNVARDAGIQFVKNERTLFEWAKSRIVSA
jgi:hypothetical protein